RHGEPARRHEEADPIGKLWGGRFSGRMLPELERFSSSLEIDFELYPFDIAGSAAHARGLAAAGIIKRTQLAAIERGLRRVKRELDQGTFEFAPTDEDIHTAVERRLTELTPAGASLHAGRSRNDQVATDLRLYCRLGAARALGFARLSLNSIDAVADRDFALDLIFACLCAALHLSRLGEDVVLWSSSEFGFVHLVDEVASGSSLMPQKRNPDIAELLRAK